MKTRIIVIFTVAVLLLFASAGCRILPWVEENINGITPSKVIISEDREVSGFDSLDMRTLGSVVITEGEVESLTIEGSDNLVPLINTYVSGEVLIIELQNNMSIHTLNLEDLLTIEITVKDLNKITNSGLGMISMDSPSTNHMEIYLSGAGEVKISNLKTNTLDVSISGLGSAELSGESQNAKFAISGAGEIQAEELLCQNMDASIPGLGRARVWVTGNLTGSLSGGGKISYYGNPDVEIGKTGIGSLEDLGDK